MVWNPIAKMISHRISRVATKPKALLPGTTWRLSSSELHDITLPSCLALYSRAATAFAVKYYMTMHPLHRDAPYEFSSYNIKLGYALIHDGELGSNNLGPRLAISRKQRKRVTNTARSGSLAWNGWQIRTRALFLHRPTYARLSGHRQGRCRPMSVISNVVLGAAFLASDGM